MSKFQDFIQLFSQENPQYEETYAKIFSLGTDDETLLRSGGTIKKNHNMRPEEFEIKDKTTSSYISKYCIGSSFQVFPSFSTEVNNYKEIEED